MCDLIDALSNIRREVFTSADSKQSLATVRGWFKRLDSDYKAWLVAKKLQRYWPHVPEAMLLAHSNQTDLVFLRTCLWVYENGGEFESVGGAMRYWRRLKATRHQHLLTYLRQEALLHHIKDGAISMQTIIGLCIQSQEALEAFNTMWREPTSVLYTICETFGLALNASAEKIKTAWKQWAVKNHPDRGGNHDTFAIVSAAYQEWQETGGNDD